jgi:uncharacterized protein YjiS (DUF1127 family)
MAKTFSAQMMGGQIGIPTLRRAAPRPPAASIGATLTLWLKRHRDRRRMRQDLPRLTDEMLKDLKLTRKQAKEIAGRPFWRE